MISLWAFLNGNQCGAGLSDTCVGYSAADFIVLRRTYNQRVLSVLENEILVGGRCVYLEWESGNEHLLLNEFGWGKYASLTAKQMVLLGIQELLRPFLQFP